MEGMTLAELVQAMLGDNTYVSVYTEANPGGEVRGQITFTNTFAGFQLVAASFPIIEP